MSAIQQVLLSSGVLVTLPDDGFLFGQAGGESIIENPAFASATISVKTDGSLELVFEVTPSLGPNSGSFISIDPPTKTYTWFEGGNASIFSARMRTLSGTSFSNPPNPTIATDWRNINTDLEWDVRLLLGGSSLGSNTKNVLAVLEIAYTSDLGKTVIANTNVNLTVSASVIQPN